MPFACPLWCGELGAWAGSSFSCSPCRNTLPQASGGWWEPLSLSLYVCVCATAALNDSSVQSFRGYLWSLLNSKGKKEP